jgi:hypothetical protein
MTLAIPQPFFQRPPVISDHLGLNTWFNKWKKANPELAGRLDGAAGKFAAALFCFQEFA